MIITKKALPRRTVLRGIGTTLALPLLDAMVPALSATAKTAANPVRRLGFIYIPNGVILDHWTPVNEGTSFEFSPTLKSLAPFRDHLVVLSGLAHGQAKSFNDGNGDHPRSSTAWLTGAHSKRTAGSDVAAGTSADQIAARELGRHTQLPSLEMALENNEILVGACEAGYSCVYQNTISWRTPTMPLPMEIHPRAVFERLFGEEATAAEQLIQRRTTRSIVDSVTQEMVRLQKTLGASDRVRVRDYLDSVRDIEQRIQRTETTNTESTLSLPERPVDIPETFEEHAKLMFDLQVLAYQTDMTRVVSFLMARESSNLTYPNIGVPDPHHALSHHRLDPELIGKAAKINAYHVQMLAYLLEKLRTTPDGDGSLLDHVMILYGGGMSDGNLHSHTDLPALVAGGGAGRLKGGRHVRCAQDTPMANLLLALLNKAGVPTETLGDSTGQLELESLPEL